MGSLVAMSTESVRASEREDVPSIDRLLALSDGVVAIALTLLVLQLKVPSMSQVTDANSASELAAALGRGGDSLVSYVISFYVVAQFWLVHHRVFQHLAGQQEGLAWLNFAFLFTITIMPFTSALLGDYSNNPLAVDIFALNLLLASLATQVTFELGRRQGLLKAGRHEVARRAPAARRGCRGGARCVHGHRVGESRRREVPLAAARPGPRGRRPLAAAPPPGRAGRGRERQLWPRRAVARPRSLR